MIALRSLSRCVLRVWGAALVGGLLLAPPASAQSYTLQEATLDGGGGRVEAAGIVLTSSLAAMPVGTARTDRYVLYSAFPSPFAGRAAILIVHEPPGTAVEGQARDITARIVTADAPIQQAVLTYRSGAGGEATAVEMTANETGFAATIPGQAIGEGGLLYAFEVVDEDGTRLRAPQERGQYYSLPVRLGGDGPRTTRPQPGGTTQAAYRLVSVPIVPNDPTPQAVLGDDIRFLASAEAYDPTQARFYQPSGTRVSQFPRTDNFALGRAFWLIVREEVQAFDAGAGEARRLDQPFTMTLSEGWNFIGTPFTIPVPVAHLQMANGDPVRLYAYGAEGYNTLDNPVTTLEPFAGYALRASSATTLTVQPPRPAEAATTPVATSRTAADAPVPWRLRLRGSGPAGADADNVAAVHPAAADGWDPQDWPEPPSISDGLRIGFDAPDGAPADRVLSADLRRPFTDGATWPLTVRATVAGPVRLSVDGVEQVPAAFEVWLLDLSTKATWDLRDAPTARLDILGSGGERALRLVVGTDRYVQRVLRDLDALPQAYALRPPYPNPSSGPVAFQVGLPTAQRIRVEVYNILGQRVAVLKDNEPMTAGFHTLVWRAPRLASGVYFVRMEAGDYRKVQKLVRVQ